MATRMTRSGRITATTRLTFAGLAAVAGMIAPALPAGAARAGAVSNVTVTNAAPTAAAGSVTTYVVHLKVSGGGALSGNAGDTITITLPAGTTTDDFHGGNVIDGSTQVGGCFVNSETVVGCAIYSGSTVAGGDSITLELNGVTNPSTPKTTYTLTVKTTRDTTAVTSPAYTVVAAHSLTNLTASNAAPTTAAGGLTTYHVAFKASTTGGMAGNAGSTITVTLPAGTSVANFTNGSIVDGATQVGGCFVPDTTKPVVACAVYSGTTTAAGDTITADLNGVSNPTTPKTTYKLTVATSSDPTAVTSPAYTVVAAHPLTNLTVAIGSPSASAKGLTTYKVAFKASATGGMSGTTGSLITVTLPAGTSLAHFLNGAILDGATQVGGCFVTDQGGTVVTCAVYSGTTTAAGDTITTELNGIVNPTAPKTYKLTVSTTSDIAAVTSPNYTVTAVSGVTAAKVVPNSIKNGASNVTYAVSFKAATGLAGASGSTVTVTLPAGTGVNALDTSSAIFVGSTQVGICQVDHGTVVVCGVYIGDTVAAGATVKVTLIGVKNPATSGPYVAKVSTSSDTTARSFTYCIVATGVPCISGVKPGSGAVGDAVTITGVNLKPATAVKFHGTAATVGTNTATRITTTVPVGATSGTITVTTSGGVATSRTAFTVVPPPPARGRVS